MDSAVAIQRRLFSPAEFERIVSLRILPECVELNSGVVQDRSGGWSPHCWTYDQYVELGRAGVLDEDDRIELIDGEIVAMTPVGHRHIYVVDQLTQRLTEWLRGSALVRVQSPVRFNSIEAPHPDLTVLRSTEDQYRSRQAGPWDALLVVEVADTSVTRDRDVKGPMYARAAIPEFWLVDVNRPVVAVHLTPVAGEYADVREFGPGESWFSPALGREISVDTALGLPLPPA